MRRLIPPIHFRPTLALTGVVSATLCAAFAPGAAMAAAGPLKSAASGLCMDVLQKNPAPGTAVQIWPCNGGSNQTWEFTAARELRTLDGTRCLDAQGWGTAPGTPILSYTCNGQANQRWTLNGNGTIQAGHTKMCLEVTSAAQPAGARLKLANCHGHPNQVWKTGSDGAVDTQAPTRPSGLKLSELTCTSAVLTWSASQDNVGVTHYDIYHDGQLMVTVGGTTLSQRLALTAGASWGLYVNARDAAGLVSQASTTLPVKVPQCSVDTQAPTTPTGLTGTVAGTTATLSWTASRDNVSVTAYDVFRNDVKVGTTPTPRFTDSGLAVSTAYRYSVAARDAQNNTSARSTSTQVTTAGACSNAVCSVKQVATDTDIPWGLATLPDATVLYTRRDSHEVVRLNPTTGAKTVVGTVPNVENTDGEGGLLGLAVTPAFPATDPWLYLYHTSPVDNRIVRMKFVNGKIDRTTLQVLLAGIGRNKYHNGGRLRFGPDGKLYAATGDAQNAQWAQNTKNLAGKILRLNPDGSIPSDNPFGNAVWSYGHRNPQGLAFDSQGRLWEQEFGNSLMDETNLIQKGGNYGWPNCEGTIHHAGDGCHTAGYIAPKWTYPTHDGSCSGIAVVRDVLYAACARGTRVSRLNISGSSLTNLQHLFVGTYGRLRTVEPTLDGHLWLTTTTQGDKDSTAHNSNEKVFKVTLGR